MIRKNSVYKQNFFCRLITILNSNNPNRLKKYIQVKENWSLKNSSNKN